MKCEPHVRHLDDYEWETRPGRADGVCWKLLVDADRTPTHGFSLGVLQFPPGTVLAPHRHAPQEIYWLQQGRGRLRIGAEIRTVAAGTIVYIPKKHRARH